MKRILIIGCGDIALRVASLLRKGNGAAVGHPAASPLRGLRKGNGIAVAGLRSQYRLFGLVRNAAHHEGLRAAGIIPVLGDLDQRHSLHRLAGLAHTVLHFAPPANAGVDDLRTHNLLAALARGTLPRQLIYISTSGVYGDCGGAVVTETHPLNAQNLRAQRRVDAEKQIRAWAQKNGVHACILRVPGIYAADRLPLQRLQQGTPAIMETEDSYTNHIHADDLARCVVAAMHYAKPNRVVHTSDDSDLKMGAYFDAVADAYSLPRPPRISRAEAQRVLSPMMLSFMNESRRLSNTRMKRELKIALHYPTVADALLEMQNASP